MGRNWTESEDIILKEMVSTHGKQWALIATKFSNRSASQIAARWEKCLDPTITKGPFTAEEDKIILDFVTQNGPRSWPRIGQILPNRSPKQCRERWFNHLSPDVIKGPWTKEEDQLIYEQHRKIGPKWSTISKLIPGRTDNAIKNRWNSSIVKRLHVDTHGNETLQPDSSHRQNRHKPAKERFKLPPPIIVPANDNPVTPDPPPLITPSDVRDTAVEAAAPPSIQIPFIDTSSISPIHNLTPFSLDSSSFSPTSPFLSFALTPFGSMQSPSTSHNPFVFSPTKPSDDAFKYA